MKLSALLLILSISTIAAATRVCKSTHSVTDEEDCVCGVGRSTTIELCHDENTYYPPTITQIPISCGNFSCMNNGSYDPAANHCACKGDYHGRCCENESKPKGLCGEVLVAPSGTIASFGLTGFKREIKYLNNMKCVWRISVGNNQRIALNVKDGIFEVEQGYDMYNCRKDRLDIYDGKSKDAVKLGSFCGKGMRKLESIVSSGSDLYLEFHSDSEGRQRGFMLEYNTFLRGSECGYRTKFSLPTAVIESPNYPIPYSVDSNCTYEIEALPGHDIVITMLEINMQARADCTNGDKIILSKTEEDKPEQILTVFCGTRLYPRYTVKTPKSVFIKFTSDSQRNGTFRIRYNQEPSVLES